MNDCDSCPRHSGIEARIDAHYKEVDIQIEALCAKIDLRIGSIRESISLAKEEMERRLDGMNHLQSQMKEMGQVSISRTELRLEIEKLVGRILALEEKTSFRAGSKHWTDYIITSLVALGVFLFAHYVLKF